MIEELIRPEIRSFIPYNANQRPYKIKLDANESPFNLPLEVRKKLADFILKDPKLNLYPDTDSIELRKAIGEYWEVPKEGIIVGTGSDQLIQVIANVFIGIKDKVLYPVPSFSMYRDSCIIAGGVAVKYLLDPIDKYEYSSETIIKAYEKEQPKLIYI
ncbi:MAG: aminotransferase class I/II-fold pyridoxal phosphate-dependent enzyme, partial [Ruminiclostridium sp.]